MKKNNSTKIAKHNENLLLLTFILSLTLLFVACTDETDPQITDPVGEMTFTLEELAEYDGKDGNRAYIAVDGIVYDVTDIEAWAGGTHADGQFTAGKDYSDEIREISPHGTGVLSRAVVVGSLVD
ncbi:MAG: cytochrome b5 domain-containing protein [Eubacteriales bacterium]|nr:cytochrome b5 domain-containing protein [Eubacteriales bacterium]MDD4540736.1 cytochrome b5 domain-containing protein [Eubacteriales bacterium]